MREVKPTDKKWLTYWRNNPVNALSGLEWFEISEGRFKTTITVNAEDHQQLIACLQEVIDYRLAQYDARLPKDPEPKMSPEDKLPHPDGNANLTKLPYYPNIKIACGHF